MDISKLYNNRGYLVTTDDFTRCIHGIQLVQRGHADYKACEKCFALVHGQHAYATEFARAADKSAAAREGKDK